MDEDRNNLAYWYPILADTGVRTPKTEIIETGCYMLELLDGKEPEGFDYLLGGLLNAADLVGGFPIFLRTGHTSGKHQWKYTCYVERPDDLGQHVADLVEASEFASIFGMPCETWAVREFLKLRSSFTAYEGMPISVEVRSFIHDHQIVCRHNYWTHTALESGNPRDADWNRKWLEMSYMIGMFSSQIRPDVQCVADAFDGDWSVDFALADDGTAYAIDMALAKDSFHWPGCPHNIWNADKMNSQYGHLKLSSD